MFKSDTRIMKKVGQNRGGGHSLNSYNIKPVNVKYLTASLDAGRSECKFRQLTVTCVYLRLRHTASKIKHTSLAFCFCLVGYV